MAFCLSRSSDYACQKSADAYSRYMKIDIMVDEFGKKNPEISSTTTLMMTVASQQFTTQLTDKVYLHGDLITNKAMLLYRFEY